MSILIDNLLRDPRVGVDVDNETIEFTPDGKLRVKDLGITPSKLSFGTWVKIGEISLSTFINSVSFTNISTDFKILKLIVLYRGDNTDTFIRFNNDSGNNYFQQILISSGTSTSSSSSSGTAFVINQPTHNTVNFEMLIYQYNISSAVNPVFYKRILALIRRENDSILFTGIWQITDSRVSTITLFKNTGNFYTYSSFILLGLKWK